MNLLHINNFAEPLGGAEIYMYQLMEELGRRGHRAGLFAGSENKEESTPVRRVVKRPAFQTANLIDDEALLEAFAKFTTDFQPDLIHVHNCSHLPPSLVYAIGRLGIPAMMTVHDGSPVCTNSWLVYGDGTPCSGGIGGKCLKHGCEKNYPFDGRVLVSSQVRARAIRQSFDAFVAPSRFLCERMSEHGFRKVSQLPYWIEPKPEQIEAPRFADRDPGLVIFLGRPAREKGIDYLLRAWKTVLAARPEARLEVIGSLPEDEGPELIALARELGLDADAIFRGRVEHAEVAAIQARASVQVVPSIWGENHPVSIYECYTAGLPVVGSAIGGIGELVREGETGLLARPRDPEHLASRLLELLGDPALGERLSEGCRASAEAYSKAKHFERLLPIYEDLTSNRERYLSEREDLDDGDVPLLDTLFEKYDELENWATGMYDHIQWLERQGGSRATVSNMKKFLRVKLSRRGDRKS